MAVVPPARALDSEKARSDAQQSVQGAERDIGSIQITLDRVRREQLSTENRNAAGELHMRTKDYDRALVVLNQVVELHRQGKVPETSYADGLFLLAETYFKDGQFLAAQRHYKEIVEQGTRRPFDSYAGRSLGRLVDVALRAQRLDSLD
jgi:tetratricopeptide (TPR) repeat protein